MENNWISVDIKPKEEKYYLVNSPGCLGVWPAYWDSEEWIHPERDTDGRRRKITEFVIDYMDIPQPPKK